MSLPPRRPKPLRGNTPKPIAGRTLAKNTRQQSPYNKLCFDAERFVKNKDYDTAFQIYQKAVQLSPPGDSKALKGLCKCYRKKARKAYKKGLFNTVQELLEAMLKLPLVKPHLKGKDYQVLAEAYIENQCLEQAAQAIRHALEIKPELSESIHGLQKRLKAEQLHQDMKKLY